MMPDKDGWDVCKEIRQESSVPIIMLTARSEDIDKIIGLDMGADDYMTKPFNPRELNARVRAVLRRATTEEESATKVREVGNVIVDTDSHEVTVGGSRINLRVKEFDLLTTLMDHKNIVLSRDQLLDQVWGYEYYGNTRTVDVHVAHLRDKLEGATVKIETVWGKGYKLTD